MDDQHLFAMEIHDVSLWEPSRVLPVVDTMERWGYNALVLHQNDLLDVCTQLGLTANYGVSDLRLKKVRNNVAWLNRLVHRLDRFGAKLFLEIKEPSYHDYALEFFPSLVGDDGAPDPFDPSWQELCRTKTSDLLARVPGIAGLIVNISSPESRVSLPDYVATHGTETGAGEWFECMIAAFDRSLREAGKALYIRDFSYTADMQSDVLAAVARNPAVGASVKITAHDYFPEFPENPVARSVNGPLLLELEAFGEHMGWGVIPNCRVAEFRDRMAGYREMGANGFLMRISWEAISGSNALDSLSAVNVFAAPRLARADADADSLVRMWLVETFGIERELAGRAADLMLQSWHIPAAAYWNGKVFPRHSCLPSTWQEGWLSMQSNGMGRRDRDLAISPDDPDLTDEARDALFQRKEEATALANRLAGEARALADSLPPGLANLFTAFDWLPAFARTFELGTKATFYAARWSVRASEEDRTSMDLVREDLFKLADELQHALSGHQNASHHYHVLFDPEQIRNFARSLPERKA